MPGSSASCLLVAALLVAPCAGCLVEPSLDAGPKGDAGALDAGELVDGGGDAGAGDDAGDPDPGLDDCALVGETCAADRDCCGDLSCAASSRCEDPLCPGDDTVAGRASAPSDLLAVPADAVLTSCVGARFLDVFAVHLEAGEELQLTLQTEGLPPDVILAQGEPDLDLYLLGGPPTGVTDGYLSGDVIDAGYSFFSTERVRFVTDEAGTFYVAVTPYTPAPGRYRLIARKGAPCSSDAECEAPHDYCRVHADTPTWMWTGLCGTWSPPACGGGPDEGGADAHGDSTAVPYAAPVSGTLCKGDVDVFTFDALSTETLRVRLSLDDAEAPGRVLAALQDPFGEVYPVADVSGLAPVDATAFLPWDGPYLLYVEHAQGVDAPDRDVPYTLAVDTLAPCASDQDCTTAGERCRFANDEIYPPIALFFCDAWSSSCGAGASEPLAGGDSSSDAIALEGPIVTAEGALCRGDVDVYAVTAEAGDNLLVDVAAAALPAGHRLVWALPPAASPPLLDRLSVSRSETFPAAAGANLLYLTLLTPDGRPPVDVPYSVRVEVAKSCASDADCQGEGAYCRYGIVDSGDLMARCAAWTPPGCGVGPEDATDSHSASTAVPYTEPVAGLLCTGDVDVFSVSAGAGDFLHLEAAASLTRPDESITVVLVDPGGAIVGSGSVDDVNPRVSLVLEAPTSGAYLAFVEHVAPPQVSSVEVPYDLALRALPGCTTNGDCAGDAECVTPFLGTGADATAARVCEAWPAPSCGVGPEDQGSDSHTTATARPYSAPLSGALCAADLDVYSFGAQTGDLFDVRVEDLGSPVGWGIGVALTSPDGALVASGQGPHPIFSTGQRFGPLAQGGTHFLHLSSFATMPGAVLGAQRYALEITEVRPCRDDGDCGADACVLPDVYVTAPLCAPPLGDVCSDGDANGSQATAETVEPGAPLARASCEGDLDYFVLPHDGPADLTVSLDFDDAAADLDLYVYAPDGTLYAAAQSINAPEVIFLPAVPSGDYRAIVGTYGCYAPSCTTVPYTLSVEAAPATCGADDECVPTTNGFPAAGLDCNNNACRRPVGVSLRGRDPGQSCFDDYDCSTLSCDAGTCASLAP